MKVYPQIQEGKDGEIALIVVLTKEEAELLRAEQAKERLELCVRVVQALSAVLP